MTTTASQIAIALDGAATQALGQFDGHATWLWDVTTDDGDAIVEPGETAVVTLAMLMETDQPYEVVGIGITSFDTLGIDNAANGHIAGWQVLNDLDYLVGDTTTTDGVSLFNTNAAQFPNENFADANPVDVLKCFWQPDVAGDFAVEYATITHEFSAWVTIGDPANAVLMTLPVVEADIGFEVVPAPPALLTFTLLTPLASRRHRAATTLRAKSPRARR